MGCTSSKLDDLPAVNLCRQRCINLDEAIRQRYAFAQAHFAYIHSLKEIGVSLDHFFGTDLDAASASPLLPLPPQRKGDPLDHHHHHPVTIPPPPVADSSPAVPYHSHSNSGSGHLHFQSSDEDDDDDESLHHSGNSSPLHHYNHQDYETLDGGGGYMTMNYMRNRSTPSVVHQHKPMSPETVHQMGGSSYFPYNYQPTENPNPYPYYNYPPTHSNYGFSTSPPQYGSSSSYYPPPPQGGSPPMGSSAASTSKPPPPPPSPPRASAWDFLNPFETFDKYYTSNTPSRDSREVREEEGIPDLEDDNYQDEVVKEVHGEQKFSDSGSRNHSKRTVVDEDQKRGDEEMIYEAGPSGSGENKGAEHDVHLVDKNVVANEERAEERINATGFKARNTGGFVAVSDVIREIRSQFDRAFESGNEVCRMLEVGKVLYHKKKAVYQASSKMLHSITPSLSVVSSQPSTSAEPSSSAGPVYLDIDTDVGMRSGNLSSTLQKLYIWEKKLYDEVKAEEKMRIFHERKLRRLRRLDEKGAEAHKIDSTRTLIRTLSTKIRIAIQVVDKISVKINKLRDEELWPQINELLGGLIAMWKVMLECHQTQCQAITEAKNLDAITLNRKFSAENVAATMQLEHELLNWISNFSCWVGAQKGYVRALNGWLNNCLIYEPEETVDGVVPFSPGRIGAPPVFVICNQWSKAMEDISEKEVIDAMRIFTLSVHQIVERHHLELRQRILTNRDMERESKVLERKEQKIQKEWQAIDRKMVLVSGQGIGLPVPGQIIHQSDSANTSSLQAGLKQIFEAMERFTASSMQAYEELRIRSEEESSRENAKAP